MVKSNPRQISYSVSLNWESLIGMRLPQVAEFFQKLSEQYSQDAALHFDEDCLSDSFEPIRIYGTRPETTEEIRMREAQARRKRNQTLKDKRHESMTREQEDALAQKERRKQYMKLKSEFETI